MWRLVHFASYLAATDAARTLSFKPYISPVNLRLTYQIQSGICRARGTSSMQESIDQPRLSYLLELVKSPCQIGLLFIYILDIFAKAIDDEHDTQPAATAAS